jgi:hypothetical protein
MVIPLVEFVKPVAQLKTGCTRRALANLKARRDAIGQGNGSAQNAAHARDHYIPFRPNMGI